jgi:hypothetical protein
VIGEDLGKEMNLNGAIKELEGSELINFTLIFSLLIPIKLSDDCAHQLKKSLFHISKNDSLSFLISLYSLISK